MRPVHVLAGVLGGLALFVALVVGLSSVGLLGTVEVLLVATVAGAFGVVTARRRRTASPGPGRPRRPAADRA